MTYLGIFLIIAINCVILMFASFLAAGGDGSVNGVRTVWLFGYTWIAVFSIASLIQCYRGNKSTALGIAAGTLPAAYVAGVIILMCTSAIKLIL